MVGIKCGTPVDTIIWGTVHAGCTPGKHPPSTSTNITLAHTVHNHARCLNSHTAQAPLFLAQPRYCLSHESSTRPKWVDGTNTLSPFDEKKAKADANRRAGQFVQLLAV